ncbi:hypothetical protein [Flavobacterium sp.]|uniref:hypothetical protein n=1 Tax=Flavobacterium sp. TaxID=239 RepID=UPI00286DA001|nr:hypothetical protein [Flavobacterium sp.]
MEEIIEKIKANYSFLKIDKIEEEEEIIDEDGDTGEIEVYTYYTIADFKGNKDISINVLSDTKAQRVEKFLKFNSIILDEYLGVKVEEKYEFVLTLVSSRYLGNPGRKQHYEIQMNYFKNELKITLESNAEDMASIELSNLLRPTIRRNWLLTIQNFRRTSPDGLNSDLRNILNSVLFDFEYSFNLAFEPILINNVNKRIPRLKRSSLAIPSHPINFTYKKYIPELIQYYHLSEKVEYIPFKFLCYFHIIEYFSDKSAYIVVAEQVKHLLLKPDFHLKTDNYIEQAINIFKKENEKHLTDKIKLTRVLQQFVSMTDFQEYLDETKLLDHFKKDQIFQCSKPLKISALDFTNETTFFQSLASRIYAMRCSIVHSNPDFDETKAVPFVHTTENVSMLNLEMALVYEVSRNIIVKSSDTR